MDWLDDQVRRGRIEEDAARCICWEDILQFAKSGIGRRSGKRTVNKDFGESDHLYWE